MDEKILHCLIRNFPISSTALKTNAHFRKQEKKGNAKPSRSTDNSKSSPYNKFARNVKKNDADKNPPTDRSNKLNKNGPKTTTDKFGRPTPQPQQKQQSPSTNNRLGKFSQPQNRYGRNTKAGIQTRNQKKKKVDEYGPDFKGKKIRVFKNGDFEGNGVIMGIEDNKYKDMDDLLKFMNKKVTLPHDVSIKKLYTTVGIQILNPERIKDDGQYVVASKIFTPGAYMKKKNTDNDKENKEEDRPKYGLRVHTVKSHST